MPDSHRTSSVRRVAIVGGGPRGLAAAEALARKATGHKVLVTLFEPDPAPGAGPNYAPDQTRLNLLNIPLRNIDLPADIEGGTFADWVRQRALALSQDDYPSRALLGHYLTDRFTRLGSLDERDFRLEPVAARVADCRRVAAGWLLRSDDMEDYGPFDEVLLCPGHQPVEDEQTERWKTHAAASAGVFAGAYPSHKLLAETDWRGRTVGIRGFGLAMIDVTRCLTEGLGGQFTESVEGRLDYVRSGAEPEKLIPFSLNGMPPAPKPASGDIDKAWCVNDVEQAAFQAAVGKVLETDDATLGAVFDELSFIAGCRLGADGEARVRAWLDDGAKADPGVPDEERPAQAMTRYLAMAQGLAEPSVGYAAGQIWRHLQNDLRMAYNPRGKSPELAEALVGFDDGMKRFSYGPPAEATRRMLALVDAGLLVLRQVDDPDIECVPNGWRIVEGDDADIASAMVDSVLPGPVIDKVASPLLASFRNEGILAAVGDKLGARVTPQGQVIEAGGAPVAGLSLLGRLSHGAVIATDSLHDCFGAAVERWAARVMA